MVKKYNLKSRITSSLRKLWLFSPMRREAVKRGKQNGSKCEKCNSHQEKLEVDHKVPVVPISGFDNWDAYINRLMCDSKDLINLCTPCHKAKTTIQREQRKKCKKKLSTKAKKSKK